MTVTGKIEKFVMRDEMLTLLSCWLIPVSIEPHQYRVPVWFISLNHLRAAPALTERTRCSSQRHSQINLRIAECMAAVLCLPFVSQRCRRSTRHPSQRDRSDTAYQWPADRGY